MSYPKISGGCKSRFHPTKAVLACGSEQVIIFKAANKSVPFSDWRIEQELKGRKSGWIKALEWNVSYFHFHSNDFLYYVIRQRTAVATRIYAHFRTLNLLFIR